jgi:hypothetical protein
MCWRRLEKIRLTDRVRSEVRYYIESRRTRRRKRRKVNWTGNILRRSCLLKHIIEGKVEGGVEMTGIQGRRCKQLLDDLTEREDTGN